MTDHNSEYSEASLASVGTPPKLDFQWLKLD